MQCLVRGHCRDLPKEGKAAIKVKKCISLEARINHFLIVHLTLCYLYQKPTGLI